MPDLTLTLAWEDDPRAVAPVTVADVDEALRMIVRAGLTLGETACPDHDGSAYCVRRYPVADNDDAPRLCWTL